MTLWLSSEAIAACPPRRSGRRGGQRRYSDLAIATALTLRLLYHLPLRQAEGFLHSLFGVMRLDLSAPTTRRSPGAISICSAVCDRFRPARVSISCASPLTPPTTRSPSTRPQGRAVRRSSSHRPERRTSLATTRGYPRGIVTITLVKQLGRRRWKPRAVRPHLTTNLFAINIVGNKNVGIGIGRIEEGGVELG